MHVKIWIDLCSTCITLLRKLLQCFSNGFPEIKNNYFTFRPLKRCINITLNGPINHTRMIFSIVYDFRDVRTELRPRC